MKKLFEWTPRDIAEWEKIRSQGRQRFITRYGLMLSAGILFVLALGSAALFTWGRTSVDTLFPWLVVIAVACLVGGVVNGLITWNVEEGQYRKYKQKQMEAMRDEPRTEN